MPSIAVLILTVSEKDADLFNALKGGARGYLLKDASPEQIKHAVNYAPREGPSASPP